MAHRYGHPISVTLAGGPDRPDSRPTPLPRHWLQSFVWRDQCYAVAEIIATWHLRDRWWERAGAGASDRTYYRVCCRGSAGEQLFDLYHDTVTGCWVLDLAHD